MLAIILAAGEGKRLRPLTYTRPKPMIPIANKPILEHLILQLKKAGINEIILVVGYKSETIKNYFNNGKKFGVSIKYVFQSKPLGTAHALKSAVPLIKDYEDFIVLNGDNILNHKEILKIVKEELSIGVLRVENPENFGVIEIKKGRIERIIEKPEKPPTNLINAGVYHFKKDIIKFLEKTPLSKRGEYEITDTIQIAINEGIDFKPVEIKEWINVEYPWDLLKANELMLKNIHKSEINGKIEENVYIKGNVVIGENTVIKSGSYIIGPVIIGENCEIGPNSYIRPYTSIGNNCRIGANVEIKNSIIMSNTKIPHFNYVGDSIIGENCNFGAGTKIANLRLDEQIVYATIKGKRVSTKRKKFGAAIGDNVKTGINVSINPGSLIGNNVLIGPSAVVDGFIEPFSKIF